MPPTLKQFERFQREKTGEHHAINLELLKVAAVKTSELTGHPAWDHFLESLQALLDEAEMQVVNWTDACVRAMDTDEMRHAQRQVAASVAQVVLLKHIMALPNEILKEWDTNKT